MGQAKMRGTFERRRWIAQERQRKEEEKRKLQLMELEAAMTPEQNEKRRKAGALVATMLGLAEGVRLK